ncbi:hypothetical protein [Lelliottia nimipressuralis]
MDIFHTYRGDIWVRVVSPQGITVTYLGGLHASFERA